jgi:hypothetical protein
VVGKTGQAVTARALVLFEGAHLASRESIGRMLDILAAHLPQALPSRYGVYEPPEHRFEKTGRAHLLGFLAEHLRDRGVVWHAQPPVAEVIIQVRPPPGWQRSGHRHEYRCSLMTLHVDADGLRQPGLQAKLDRAWRSLSAELRPFFGDVRHSHAMSDTGTASASMAPRSPLLAIGRPHRTLVAGGGTGARPEPEPEPAMWYRAGDSSRRRA